MKNKNLFLIIGAIVLLVGGFLLLKNKKSTQPVTPKTPSLSTKLLVNELPLAERPFTLLVPHATNRLFTFVMIGADKAQAAALDIEYQSGDLLKGAKASIDTPIANTFIKAVILGSCSTGGKCSFDKDLKSGTLKLKLGFAGQDVTHVLKGDFVYLTGQKNLPDGKVIFEPAKTLAKENLIMLNSFGVPKPVDKEILLYPVVISAVSDKTIAGTLTFNQSDVVSAAIYDGQAFQPLKLTAKDGAVTVALNQKPWSMKAEIIRDDEKGSKESVTLYLVGPIVLFK